jgi:hypothetical protein
MSSMTRPTPGTTMAALTLTSSATTAFWRDAATPLGSRYAVYTVSVTGRRQEIALCRTRERAALIAAELTRAAQALQAAAGHLAADREEA